MSVIAHVLEVDRGGTRICGAVTYPEPIRMVRDAVIAASERHPKPANQQYQYGTAGFRMKSVYFPMGRLLWEADHHPLLLRANLLDSVIYRVGILAPSSFICLSLNSDIVGTDRHGFLRQHTPRSGLPPSHPRPCLLRQLLVSLTLSKGAFYCCIQINPIFDAA